MKTVIFSDTHFFQAFDEKRFDFLKKIISESDKVIINGDFWDGLVLTFDEFVTSEWSRLFPYLLEKDAVYIYGNHDIKEYSDERVNLFSTSQADSYTTQVKDKKIIVEHGHRLVGDLNDEFPWIHHRLDAAYALAIRMYVAQPKSLSPVINFFARKIRERTHRKLLKAFTAMYLSDTSTESIQDTIFIFGHTHIQFDNRENGYIVDGEVSPFRFEYVTIDDVTGSILLKHQ